MSERKLDEGKNMERRVETKQNDSKKMIRLKQTK
jgi:hypothetical protein